jgi:hypothetical protein
LARELRLRFRAVVIEWRGPAPFFFAALPEGEAAAVRAVAKALSYGWGVIPVEAAIGGVRFTTSLFPRDETYLLPIKVAVRRRAGITMGDDIEVELVARPSGRSGMPTRA